MGIRRARDRMSNRKGYTENKNARVGKLLQVLTLSFLYCTVNSFPDHVIPAHAAAAYVVAVIGALAPMRFTMHCCSYYFKRELNYKGSFLDALGTERQQDAQDLTVR